MRFTVFITLLFLLSFSFFSGSAALERKKPEASFMGMKKGNIDKLTFIGAKEIDLDNNKDSLWSISSYEFDFSCDGKMLLKHYNGNKIDKEIMQMVKNCKNVTVADFRYIKAKNRKSGKEIRLNDIELRIQN